MNILKAVLAFLLPPVSVLLHRGPNVDFLVNLVLWLCFHIPGVIHAIYVLLTKEEVKE